MAAIDKIYVDNWEQYIQFKEWCEEQPFLTDKYGVSVPLTRYVYNHHKDDSCFVTFQGPYYADAYLIRNCPFDFIQKELMLNYGHWSQEKINEAYECVTHRTEENKIFYTWLSESDFKIVDGVITMPNLEKSDYEKIKNNELYNTPFTNKKYEIGTKFKCIKHPIRFYNKPYNQKSWFIDVIVPDELGFMWYHDKHNSWDFSDDFVVSTWSSSTAFCKTIKALKRLMLKWKLPKGTIVRASGRYVNDEYKFIIK
jgi:hypothetical protein